MNQPFNDTIFNVKSDIEKAQQAKKIWFWIADHANEINGARYGYTFIILQHYSFSEFFRYFGRIFDKRQDTNCLKTAVRKMKNAKITNVTIFEDFLEKHFPSFEARSHTWSNLTQDERLKATNKLLKQGQKLLNKCDMITGRDCILKKLLLIRHRELAHNSVMEINEEDRQTWEDAQSNIDWAKDFLDMCWKAFSPGAQYMEDGTFVSESQFPCPLQALTNITDKLGIVDNPQRIIDEQLLAEEKSTQ